jgi:hypothetical protein
MVACEMKGEDRRRGLGSIKTQEMLK